MNSSPVNAAATLRADQPLYTPRDKQVTLVGAGYTLNQPYYVWERGPDDNSTRYTGVTFMPVAGGLIPPSTVLPITAVTALGTYLVSVSTSSSSDNSQAKAHYGIWGTMSPLYQRTQSVKIFGGGLFPGISFKLTIRNPAGNFVHEIALVSTRVGDFNDSWRIPEDGITDAYTVFIDGTGTYDDAQQDYVSLTKFTVTQATLSAEIVTQPYSLYQRTDDAKLTFALKYPDGSPVLKSKSSIQPVVLLINQTIVSFATLSLVDVTNGIWGADSRILPNATLSLKYRFQLPATSFDDGFGNKGPASDTFSGYFEVDQAKLVITSELNGTQIQIPFGQVSILSKVNYPDGTRFTNGTVRVLVSTGSSSSDLKSVYDSSIGAWRASYSSDLWDLTRIGTWSLHVEASDAFGNSGVATYEVTAQPYLFLASLAIVIAFILFARWTVSRYGRKVYFRLRKTIMRFKR
jgi:hypothetical protein